MERSRNQETYTTLRRFAVRLAVVLGFVELWPDRGVTSAAAILCVALAIGCALSATLFEEPLRGAGLNHWHEAVALLGLALAIYLGFSHGN